MKVSWLPKNI
jgi:hypothetical protein